MFPNTHFKDHTTPTERLGLEPKDPVFGKALLLFVAVLVVALIAVKLLASQYGI